ncbi:DUF488 domain-containing protein [Nocardia vinacea]|uniref:DUF488 domain-containing protein n=1 Tax=Nocardia vinacea TaxID=96468 RepID=UPI00031C3A03|nr:DUF488 domain-containing protein [Nocardia vinacea]
MMSQHITYRRIYEAPIPSDGTRVLVDRVWPRGIRKEDAHLDEWMRDIAPSTELRKWYGHQPERFAEFRRRYLAELRDTQHRDAVAQLRDIAREHPVTLLTATRDVDHSQAAVLANWIAAEANSPD